MLVGAISRSSVERTNKTTPALLMPVDKAETRLGVCLAVQCSKDGKPTTQLCELPYPFNVNIVLRRIQQVSL